MVYRIEFFVDGGCRRNGQSNSVAAAAAVRMHRRHHKAWTRDLTRGTNQRAEITAIILALERAIYEIESKDWETAPRCAVTIHSDSKYAVNCMNEWIYKWLNNGWVNARGDEVANRDLIERASDLDDQVRELASVKYVWVPRAENKLADEYCNTRMDQMEESNRRTYYDHDSDDSDCFYFVA